MKKVFAVPTENGTLCSHFGHCESFTVINTENGALQTEISYNPPAHEPGSYPAFLSKLGVNVIIAGGMGATARQLFAQNNIEVCMGVTSGNPQDLVKQYLADQLITGENQCDGSHDHSGHHTHRN